MNAAVYTEDLQSLQAILQDWLGGMPLDFRCTSQEGALKIEGQHSAEVSLEAGDLLHQLERRIQSLQLRFVQQARLYLRVVGEPRPYAQRFFLIQPPPPPLPRTAKAPQTNGFQKFIPTDSAATQETDDEFWAVSDEELDDLVNELVGDLQALSLQKMPALDETTLSEPMTLVAEEWESAGAEVIGLNVVEAATALPEVLVTETDAADPVGFSSLNGAPPPRAFVGKPSSSEPVVADRPSVALSGVNSSGADSGHVDSASTASSVDWPVADLSVADSSAADSSVVDSSAIDLSGSDPFSAEAFFADPFALVAAEETEAEVSADALSLVPWDGEPDVLSNMSKPSEPGGSLLPPQVAVPRSEAPEESQTDTTARLLWVGGAIALGVAGSVYGLSRPCVVGSCPELQTAQDLEQAAVQQAEAAQDVEGLAEAQAQLERAIATLETIPGWSSRAGRAREQQQTYEAQAMTLGTLTEVARVAKTARDRTQEGPLTIDTWDGIIQSLETAVNRLDGVSPANPFYTTAQQQQQMYGGQLARYIRQRDMEQEAQEILNMARQGIEMAEARQQIAQSKEQWQMVRITWQVVVNRLNEVPAGTYAAIEAERLLQTYEPRLEEAIAQVQQESTAADRLVQAAEYAQQAEQSANQFNWQGAIAAWTNAIRETEQIPPDSTHASEGEELARQYQNAINNAQKKLDNHLAVSLEIDRACNEEFRKCRLLVVGDAIRVQLSADYMEAIATARNSGNRELQAVVTEHQLELRRTLQELAARFQLPIEVYDNGNTLLDRHLPNASTT